MLPSLSPLAVFNRATLILARNGWKIVMAALIFGALPSLGLQYLAMKPSLFAGLDPYAAYVLHYWVIGIAVFATAAFGNTVAKLVVLDDLDGVRRPYGALLADGLGRYMRACWLIIPVAVLNYWLTYGPGLLASLFLYCPLIFFLCHYSIARHSLRDSWRASFRLFRRHGLALAVNAVLIDVVQFVAYRGYVWIRGQFAIFLTAPERLIVTSIVASTVFTAIFATWTMALYGSLRAHLDDQADLTATVFD